MFLDLVTQNRSYRRFDESKRLTRADLRGLVNHARLSPSASNRQPLRYKLVWTETDCARLFPHLRWAGYLKDWDGPAPGERPAAYVVMLLPADPPRNALMDTGISAQTILLAATEQGWGGCMFGSVDKPAVMKEFGLPEGHEIALVIALGVPAERVVIDPLAGPDQIEYWRDADSVHHVPKRSLEEIVLPD